MNGYGRWVWAMVISVGVLFLAVSVATADEGAAEGAGVEEVEEGAEGEESEEERPSEPEAQEENDAPEDPEIPQAEVEEQDEAPNDDQEADEEAGDVQATVESAEVQPEAEAQPDPVDADDEGLSRGLRHESHLQIRAQPIGLSLLSDTAFRLPLWDSDNDLLADTYVDGGIATALSPAYAWAGPYVELLPVAVLNLRVSAQGKGYFGTFGYLHVPDDGDWTPDALDETADQGLGQSATGWRVEARATPQMLIGRVVFTGETSVHRMEMDVDEPYYEPYFDLFFEPEDTFLITRPTVGYLFGDDLSEWFFLLGARWERIATRESDVVRNTVGLVWNWQIPEGLVEWGSPTMAGFYGVHIDHPNRGQIVPYLGMQFMFEF